MTNENQYLPQHTLAQLSEQVCMKLPYFTNKFKIENIWDGIFPYCLLIDKDPRNVNIVTAEVSKNTQGFVSGTSILVFHTIFTRIYVLLYYKHRDDSVFQSIVFQELISRMGVYAKVENLKTIIRDRIDRILEQDKQIEASKEEARKNPKPMFAYVPHSGTESDYLYVEYNEEELFRHMSRIIKELAERHDVHLDEADVWYNAKQVVHSLRDIKRPELMIERVASALVPGQIHNEHKGSQIILLSAYMMVRATREHSHFDNFIKKMESYALDDSFKWTVLQNIKPVKKWLDENLPLEEEWDYIGETPIRETFSRADMERVLAEYKGQIESLKKEKESQDRQVQELLAKLKEAEEKAQTQTQDDDEEETSEPPLGILHNKVKFELFLRFLELDGVDVLQANKTDIGNLWHAFTEKSPDDCRKYCSSRIYENNHTKEEIKELNRRLALLGLKSIQL